MEHENLVAKWLQNSFKIQENAALDLRATPLSLQIPMAEVNNRPVFKMNNDFWNQARGPPQSMAQNLSNSNQNSPVPGSTNSIPAHSPSQQSNGSQQNNHVITPGALALQQQQQQMQQQQQQQNTQQAHSQSSQASTPSGTVMNQSPVNMQQQQQQQSQQQPPQQLGSPNPQQPAHAQAQALVQQQQQQLMHMSQQQLSSGQNSPDKMTEKFVNELQVCVFSFFFAHRPLAFLFLANANYWLVILCGGRFFLQLVGGVYFFGGRGMSCVCVCAAR